MSILSDQPSCGHYKSHSPAALTARLINQCVLVPSTCQSIPRCSEAELQATTCPQDTCIGNPFSRAQSDALPLYLFLFSLEHLRKGGHGSWLSDRCAGSDNSQMVISFKNLLPSSSAFLNGYCWFLGCSSHGL